MTPGRLLLPRGVHPFCIRGCTREACARRSPRYHSCEMARRRKDFQEIVRRARGLPVKDQAALVETLLTPQLRLHLIVEEIRSRVRVKDDRKIDRIVDRAVRRARRAQTSRR